MIDYTTYLRRSLGQKDLVAYRKKMGKYSLLHHFANRTDWGDGIILDFGGRIGERTAFLKRVIVVEEDTSAIEWMREHNIPCESSKNLKSRFQGKKIDVIHAAHVIEHLQDPFGQIKIFHELLSDDGLLIVLLPSDLPILRPQIKKIDGGGDEHLYNWNLTEFRNLLKEAGFKIEFSELNSVPFRVGSFIPILRDVILWRLLWLLIQTFRWWFNIGKYYCFDKYNLSTAGEIIIYAKKITIK